MRYSRTQSAGITHVFRFLLAMPSCVQQQVGEIEVAEGVSAVIQARLHNTSDGWWKAGLHIDCAALVPRGSTTGLSTTMETPGGTRRGAAGQTEGAVAGEGARGFPAAGEFEQVQGDGRGGGPLQAGMAMLLDACRMQ